MITTTDDPRKEVVMHAFNAMTMLSIRAATVLLCYAVCQVITLNHFVYTVLKDRYPVYQTLFYIALFVASVVVCPPWNLSRAKWQVVLLMCVAGYLCSSIAFLIEPMIQFGWRSTGHSPLFYDAVFLSPLFSLAWLFGGIVGVAIVTLERYLVIRGGWPTLPQS